MVFFAVFVSIYYIASGYIEYKSYKSELNSFQQLEKVKEGLLSSYESYGSHGFRVLFSPNPIDILYNSSSFLNVTETNIDVTEIVKVVESKRGKSQFELKQLLIGFPDFLLFLGSLTMFFVGLTAFKTFGNLSLHKKKYAYLRIASNTLVMPSLFILLVLGMLAILKLLGASLSTTAMRGFYFFILFYFLFLLFFYFLGLLILLLTIKDRKKVFAWGFIVWVTFYFFIPSMCSKFIVNQAYKIKSIETLNLIKLNRLYDYEKIVKDFFSRHADETFEFKLKKIKEFVWGFMEKEYAENKADELAYLAEVERVMDSHGRMALIFPTIYSNYLMRELSSRSYYNYKKYLRYVLDLREQFMKYYLTKRYSPNSGKVVPFIKGDENIFRAESRLPDNFWRGVGVLGAYCLALMIICFFVLRSRLKNPIKKKDRLDFIYRNLVPEQAPYFVYCQSEKIQEDLFEEIIEEPDVVGMDHLEAADIDPELPARYILPYLYHIRELSAEQIERAETIMPRLGVRDLKYFKHRRPEEISDDDFKRIYAAIIFAEAWDKNVLVINNYLHRMSHAFEVEFQEVLWDLRDLNKWVIYLSATMHIAMSATKHNIEVAASKELNVAHIEYRQMSFR